MAAFFKQLNSLRQRILPWMILLAMVALSGVCWQGMRLMQALHYRASVAPHVLIAADAVSTQDTAQALFANAVYQDEHGKPEQALALYAQLARTVGVDDPLRKQAYFNSGNVYMRMATRLLEQQGLPAWDEAGPLVALAKESYQHALRQDPAWSEVKYNYQLALRLAPTTYGMHGPTQYEDEQIKQEEKPSGWPAMPGNPRGMP